MDVARGFTLPLKKLIPRSCFQFRDILGTVPACVALNFGEKAECD
jgi:hypothetical protein